jgi:hypothetical protein
MIFFTSHSPFAILAYKAIDARNLSVFRRLPYCDNIIKTINGSQLKLCQRPFIPAPGHLSAMVIAGQQSVFGVFHDLVGDGKSEHSMINESKFYARCFNLQS